MSSSSSSGSSGGSQGGSSGQTSAATTMTPAPQQGDRNYQGSVAEGTASSTPIALTLSNAIERGLRTNLGLLTTQQSSRETQAQRLRALSGLLPTVTGQVGETVQQINLQALGFNVQIPPSVGFSIPTVIPPYSYGDARATADIPIFNWTSISNFRSAKENLKASTLSIKNARDLVVQGVGNAYLQIIADAAQVIASQAQVDADNAQFTNASRRHDAGTATGLDVLQSQVQLQQQQQTLITQKNQFQRDKLTLGRVIGLPSGQDFTVADPSPTVPLEAITVDDALSKAYQNRPDFQAAKLQVKAAEWSVRAAKAERYPTLQANGYYGDTGLHLFSQSHGTFQATGSVQFNIFDGGRIKGDILQNNAELKNRRNDLENLRGQIDYDVRTAILDLTSSRTRVDVAQSNVSLANQTLTQSRDRFAAGVTNTVEVVQSQQQVASAYNSLISAQYQYNVAKVELARALGLAEQGIRTYFAQHP